MGTLGRRWLARIGQDRRGVAAVEFALMAAALMVLTIGLVDYGSAMTRAVDLREAARAGAQYAVRNWTATGTVSAIAKAATKQDPNSLTVATIDFCECSDGTSVACTATCSGGAAAGHYVRVTVSQPSATFISYPEFVLPATLSASSTLRIR